MLLLRSCSTNTISYLQTFKFSISKTVTDIIKARETQISPSPLFLLTGYTIAVCVELIPQFPLFAWTLAQRHGERKSIFNNNKTPTTKKKEECASILVFMYPKLVQTEYQGKYVNICRVQNPDSFKDQQHWHNSW